MDFRWQLRIDNLAFLTGNGEPAQHRVPYWFPLTGKE